MEVGILGDLRRFGLDVLVGLAIFSLLAMFLLNGEAPRDLSHVSQVLSINANAAEHHLNAPLVNAATSTIQSKTKPFRFTDGWTALSVLAVMFAMLYAFNLALYRRLVQHQARARRHRL